MLELALNEHKHSITDRKPLERFTADILKKYGKNLSSLKKIFPVNLFRLNCVDLKTHCFYRYFQLIIDLMAVGMGFAFNKL
jgi:hypothetical protein